MKKWSSIFALLVLAACVTAPFTRRHQLMLIPEAQEVGMGVSLYRDMLRRSPLSHDPEANRLVRKVGERIAQAANKPNYHWEFAVIDEQEDVNAFALPGGKVGVFTGIFPVARDEAGLAIIIGHEVAHALARHPAERMSQGLLLQLVGTAGSVALAGRVDPYTFDLIRQAYGLGATVGVMLPFSRAQEAEADRIGLILAAKAGYDPRASLQVWDRMEEKEKEAPPEFLSTHPSYGSRRGNIEKWLPEALRYYHGDEERVIEMLPGPESLTGVDPDEKALLRQMERLDRIAASSRQGTRLFFRALVEEFRADPDDVARLLQDFQLQPGEVALVFAIATEKGKRAESVAEQARAHVSWGEIARTEGVSAITLLRRLQEIERTARAFVQSPFPIFP